MPQRKTTFRAPRTAAHVEIRMSINALMEEQAILTSKATSLLQMLDRTPHANTPETKAFVTAIIEDMEKTNQSIQLLRARMLNG